MKKKELIVYSGNALIDTVHHQKFTETELKVIYWFFTQITKDDIKLYENRQVKQIVIPASELAEELQFKNTKSFNHLKKLADTIQNKTMTSKLDNGFIKITIVTAFQYKDGLITLDLNYRVLPYLIDLKSNYTQFYLENVLKLESSYAIKLYTLLKQYQNICSRKITVQELREYFNINENEYKRYSDFKVILEIATKHINKSTDISIQYREIKTSRKITGIEFYITDNDGTIQTPKINSISTLEINQVIQFFINLATFDINLTKKIIKCIKEKDNDYVIKAMLYTYTKKPKNPQAYFFTALKNGYGQNIAIGELEHLTYKKLDKFRIY